MNTTTGSELPWPAPDGGVWERDSSHQVGLATAALAELMPEPYANGFRRAFAEFGLPLETSKIAFINGRAYITFFVHGAPRKPGGPPPTPVLKAMVRLIPSARRRAADAAAALAEDRPMRMVDRWEAARQGWIDRVLAFADADVDALDDAELADHLESLTSLIAQSLEEHFSLVTVGVAVGEYLLAVERWGLDPSEARTAVLHGVPVHAESWRRLDRLVSAIGDAPCESLDDVRAISAEAGEALDEFLRFHGSWATTDDLHGPTIAERPSLLFKAVAAHRPLGDSHTEVRAMIRGTIPASEQAEFDRLADRAQRAHAMMDDNSAILAQWPMGILARSMRVAADRLTTRGALPDPSALWTLTVGELCQLLTGTGGPDGDEIRGRAGERVKWDEAEPPPFLNGEPSPPPDPSVFPGALSHYVAAVGAFIGDKLGTRVATGIGTERVRGRAVVVETAYEAFDRIEEGDILVTAATTPSFVPILPILGGLVTSEGGPACHAAVVAREFELPAVVGLDGALKSIPDGAIIELDPVAVSVEVVEPATAS